MATLDQAFEIARRLRAISGDAVPMPIREALRISNTDTVVDLHAVGLMVLLMTMPLVNRTARTGYQRWPIWDGSFPTAQVISAETAAALVKGLFDYKLQEEQRFLSALMVAIRQGGTHSRAGRPTWDIFADHCHALHRTSRADPDLVLMGVDTLKDLLSDLPLPYRAPAGHDRPEGKFRIKNPVTGTDLEIKIHPALFAGQILTLSPKRHPDSRDERRPAWSFVAEQDYIGILRPGAPPEVAAVGQFVVHAPELQGLIEFTPGEEVHTS